MITSLDKGKMGFLYMYRDNIGGNVEGEREETERVITVFIEMRKK
jgi:hypothetical protein